VVTKMHWNPKIDSFAVIPLQGHASQSYRDDQRQFKQKEIPAPVTKSFFLRDAREANNPMPAACNLNQVRIVNKTVDVRELLGFMPWYFEGLIKPADLGLYSKQWLSLFNPKQLQGPWGLRTAEFDHGCYNYSWAHGDCWNGPTWPYETARVLTSAANLLNNFGGNDVPISANQYFALLHSYARQHTASTAINDTAVPLGSGHVFENMHPDKGYWNNRAQMYWTRSDLRNMGNHYHHSAFMDLVLTGLLGIRIDSVDGSSLTLNPLVPTSTAFFAIDALKIWEHWVSVSWDKFGTKYNKGAGLQVWVDGKVVAKSATLGKLTVNLKESAFVV